MGLPCSHHIQTLLRTNRRLIIQKSHPQWQLDRLARLRPRPPLLLLRYQAGNEKGRERSNASVHTVSMYKRRAPTKGDTELEINQYQVYLMLNYKQQYELQYKLNWGPKGNKSGALRGNNSRQIHLLKSVLNVPLNIQIPWPLNRLLNELGLLNDHG